MINVFEVQETNKMIEESNLDVRTITMGISLLDCCDNDVDVVCEKIYRKITEKAANLVKVGEQIELDYGIPIVNKRISVTPIALVGGSCCKTPEDYVKIAKTLDRAAHTVGINFLGGYSALVSKGMTPADKLLIESIPQALAETELVCSSVNVGSTKTGIDMDAVKMLGETVKKTAELTKDNDSLGCAKLVIFCNAPDDNPFMAGAFHGVTEGDVVINVGVSGPGVVKRAIEEVKGQDFGVGTHKIVPPMTCRQVFMPKHALYIYYNKPKRNSMDNWIVDDNNYYYVSRDVYGNMFNFIKWEDEKPWSIEDLKKLEVKE